MSFIRALGLSLLASVVAAQATCPSGQTTCGGTSCISEIQCSSCGYAASNTGCVALNATFDDLKTGSDVATYDSALYTGFTVVTLETIPTVPITRPLPALLPDTPTNYAATTECANPYGTLAFECENMEFMSGRLLAFSFGCTTTNAYYKLAGIPQACDLSVTGYCAASDGSGTLSYTSTYSFTPSTIYGAPMKRIDYTTAAVPTIVNSKSCSNYTFSAVSPPSASSVPVTLALDTLIYTAQY